MPSRKNVNFEIGENSAIPPEDAEGWLHALTEGKSGMTKQEAVKYLMSKSPDFKKDFERGSGKAEFEAFLKKQMEEAGKDFNSLSPDEIEAARQSYIDIMGGKF